jgi:predicted DNA-binding WGR domain protein
MRILIKRRDPARRMARYYSIGLQGVLDLDGRGIAVVREWGRIGSPGTVRSDTFDRAEAARAEARVIEARKRGRGYR